MTFGGPSLLQQMTSKEAPQGDSLDQYITDKNRVFIDYISTNIKNNLVKQSYQDYKALPKADLGKQVPPKKELREDMRIQIPPTAPARNNSNLYTVPESPTTIVPPQPLGDFGDFISGPYGAYSSWGIDVLPQTVQAGKDALENPVNVVQPQPQVKAPRPRWGAFAADLGMVGMQGLNAAFSRANERKQDKFNQDQMTVENTTPLTYGSKGDYDTNSGVFRPNQKTAMQFKKGGTYKGISAAEIDRLVKEGYEFDIID